MKSQLKLNTLILLLSGLFLLPHTLFAAAGDLDTTFNGTGKLRVGVGGGADYVNAMARQSDNKLIVAGKSFGVRGDSFSLVRYNTNGTLDTTFGTGGKVLTLIGVANAVAILSDGKILAAGSNSSDFVIAKYNSNGTFDTTFGTGGIVTTDFGSVDQAYAMVVQSDGKIILAGGSSNYVAVARYNSNGTLDTSFSGDGKATQYVGSNSSPNAKAVVILNGRIYYAGNTDDRNNAGFVGCFNSDGSPNVAFGNGNGIIFIYISFNNNPVHVNSLAVLGVLAGEEKLIIAGEITGSESVQKLWSRDANNGSADNTFGNSGSVTLNAAGTTGSAVRILNSNGVASRIVVAGTITGAENNDFMIARYQLNGALDTAFDGDGIATADIYGDDGKAMLIQPTDDKIVVAGTTGKFDADFGIVRFNTNGSLDTTFSGDGKQFNDLSDAFAAAAAMIVQPDGKIVAAGETFLARFNTDGTFDTTFDGDGITRISTGYITGAAIQADGKIVLAAFYSSNTFAAYRFNADGSPDYAFDGDGIATATFTGLDANPRAVAIQSDGAIVLAGRINVGSSTSQNYDFAVARFLSNGALDNSFSGDGVATTAIFSGEDKANAVAIQSDGKIVVAGYAFNNNNNNFAIVRYTTTGALV